jgi:hypothetical protein
VSATFLDTATSRCPLLGGEQQKSEQRLPLATSTRVTPMYGPAVRSKKIFDDLAVSGLASMYPTSDWSVVLRANMDISARAI